MSWKITPNGAVQKIGSTSEFKREALRRANEEGVTDILVAEEW